MIKRRGSGLGFDPLGVSDYTHSFTEGGKREKMGHSFNKKGPPLLFIPQTDSCCKIFLLVSTNLTEMAVQNKTCNWVWFKEINTPRERENKQKTWSLQQVCLVPAGKSFKPVCHQQKAPLTSLN